jgi:prepilin-type N-terminal cleavage/methylation domain-containing protein
MTRTLPAKRQQPHAAAGMTLLEVLVAVAIASSAIAFLVPALIRQASISTEATSLTSVEAVVSRDLDWISDYARYWKLRSGPYNLSAAITQTQGSGYTLSPQVEYEPHANLCANGTLAESFLSDASSVTTTPARPYPIAGSGSVETITVATDLQLARSITTQRNRIQVLYALTGSKADSLRFSRQASVLIEAAAWCDTLP